MDGFCYKYIEKIKGILDAFPNDNFERLIETFLKAYTDGKHIFVMGNGGSASTASHLACDINKNVCTGCEKRFKVLCLNDNFATMLAYANDVSYADIFVEQLKNFFVEGDVVVGISGSGNSLNVIKAIDYAKTHGGNTIGLCGYSGGRLYHLVDIPILVPVNDMQKVEDIHMIVVHMTMQRLLEELNDKAEG